MNCSSAVIYALDFSYWKRPIVRMCFPESRIKFVSRVDKVPAHAWLAVWGMRTLPDNLAPGVQIVRLEDGFLRSVGLGADLTRPLSWVVDRTGLYYDARQSSDLEILLAESTYDEPMIARARALRERIVALRLTKYNIGGKPWRPPSLARRLILVPGQVESDASMAFGAPGIRLNMDLLRAVRMENPDAWVIYKPHPDVVARLRTAGEREDAALQLCDEVVKDVPMHTLLDAVDEVHVMTSLSGFEALLRGKRVVCYGHPFFAGWGLTVDVIPLLRRQRKLTLDQLVAAALIEYPLYFDRQGRGLITPEAALVDLSAWRDQNAGKTPWWRYMFRIILRQIVGVR